MNNSTSHLQLAIRPGAATDLRPRRSCRRLRPGRLLLARLDLFKAELLAHSLVGLARFLLPRTLLSRPIQVLHLFAHAPEASQQRTEIRQQNHPCDDVGSFQCDWARHRAPPCKAAAACVASTFSSNTCSR